VVKDLDEEIRNRLELFVRRFHTISDTLKDEEDVKSSVIDEFLKILGWNLQDHLEVKKEQKVEGRIRADYALKVDGKPKIYIEAKALDKDLEGLEISKGGGKRTYIEQAINYAYNSGVNWALLTNGKRWMLFNAYWKGTHKDRIAFDFKIDDFLKDNNFNKIKLLAREHIIAGKLDEYFKGARAFRPPVDEQIVKFLLDCRSDLTNSILKNNKDKYSADKLREGIQIILDRFLFFKICEDRDILRFGRLKEMFEYFYKAARSNELFIRGLKLHYREFDDTYDGELFAKHPCEDFIIDKNVFEKIILGLYEYDFSTIDADILGRIYENYLGNTLQELEKGLGWVADNQERKKFGQYYTPQYVVDYIIDNVGITADSKILDPACGSGAFLIKAYDRLKRLNQERIKRIIQKKKNNLSEEKFKKWEEEELPKIEEESVKKILTENVHGIDLNPESVELTKVNLWLRSIRKDTPLNKLENNIACGNSLISGAEDELKQYFGDDWKEKRPFNWEEGFPSVLQNGGFDAVVGNPPYVSVKVLPINEKKYFSKAFKTATGQFDLYNLFMEKGISLLKEGGKFSFIVSDTFLSNRDLLELRKYILNTCIIEQIVSLGEMVFREVAPSVVIIVLKKVSDSQERANNKIKIISEVVDLTNQQYKVHYIQQGYINNIENLEFRINLSEDIIKLISKVEGEGINLDNFVDITRGIETGSNDPTITNYTKSEKHKRVLVGKDIDRYAINFQNRYIPFNKNDIANFKDEGVYLQNKILIQRIRNLALKRRIVATFDDEQYYTLNTLRIITQKDEKHDLKYLLGILNSNLINYYFRSLFLNKDIYGYQLARIPIYEIDFDKPEERKKHDQLVVLVDRMLTLKKGLNKINTNFFEHVDLHPKIKDTDLGFYFNQLSMNDRKTLNNANGIRGKIKKVKVREEGDWLFVSVNYVDENDELIENFDVLKCRFENPNFQQFIKHCILNYRKSISKGNLLERILKINNIPIFNNRDKTKNQQIIDEIMDPFLPALEQKEKIETEIEETDRTIDQKVYELYGLSEKEIKIIEEVST